MKKENIIVLVGVIVILIIGIGIYFLLFREPKYEKNYVDFVRTYHIMSVDVSDEAAYVNVTLRTYDNFDTETVKILRDIIEDEIVEDAPYEFTFDYSGPAITDSIKSIFENMTLKSVKLTDNQGASQRQDNL